MYVYTHTCIRLSLAKNTEISQVLAMHDHGDDCNYAYACFCDKTTMNIMVLLMTIRTVVRILIMIIINFFSWSSCWWWKR